MNPDLSFTIEIAIKSTLILVAAFALTRLLSGASASLRHLVWISAITGMLALPVLTRVTPAWTSPKPVRAIERITIVQVAGVPAHTVSPLPAPSKVVQWIWISGALLVLGRLAAGMFRTWRIARNAVSVHVPALVADLAGRLKIRRSIRILEGAPSTMPMTWGLFRPTILVPASAIEWPVERLRIVLAHELVHVQRLDYLTQLLSQAACALYWWNPLVWLATVQVHQERERACDDGVLRLGANAPAYAGQLVELARMLQGSPRAAAVAMANPSHLENRLVALLDRSRNRQPITPRLAAAAAIAAICVIAPLAALKLHAQSAKGTIAGIVYDASKGAVPGAVVMVSNLDTKTKETTTTNEAGEYYFRQIPTGRYEVEARKPGFAAFRRNNLVLTADAPLAFNPTLEIGGVQENVEVVGTSPNRRTPAVLPSGEPPRRIRIGGNVQATRLVSQVKPVYPENAQRAGIEGTVLLHAVIATDGSLLSIGVTNTLADPDLAAAAMDAVRQWRYQPTLLNGEPIEVVTTIAVNFHLQK